MYITLNAEGKVVAYSDNLRNVHDLAEGDSQVEVDCEFHHISCAKDGLTFEEGKLLSSGELVASEVPTILPEEQ